MSDFRAAFLGTVEVSLAGVISQEILQIVMDNVTKALSSYEITERCTDVAPTDPVNERLIKKYCACLLIDGKSQNTIYGYQRAILRFSDFIHKPLPEAGTYDIRYYLACEKDRGVSNITLENTRANLSAFFQWMTLEDIIPKNPMLRVKKIKSPYEVKKPFSEVEIDSLRSACKNARERALIEILLTSGVRVSELSEMDITDIDSATLAVHVRHGKGGKERITYTTSIGLKHLLRYLDAREEKECVFLFCNGRHERLKPGGIRLNLNKIAERAGVTNVHPHRFRRTFATGLAKRGMPIEEIQKLLGHNNLNTTLKYVCTNDDQVRASYEKYIA